MSTRLDFYSHPAVSPEWAERHDTHMAVATAIHAIADQNRSVEEIWQHPTPAERNHVAALVASYLEHGAFSPTADHKYAWGAEAIAIPAFMIGDSVERGEGDVADHGHVIALGGETQDPHHLNRPGYVLVAWKSGVFTWTPITDLRIS